jgi:hypothetical protein
VFVLSTRVGTGTIHQGCPPDGVSELPPWLGATPNLPRHGVHPEGWRLVLRPVQLKLEQVSQCRQSTEHVKPVHHQGFEPGPGLPCRGLRRLRRLRAGTRVRHSLTRIASFGILPRRALIFPGIVSWGRALNRPAPAPCLEPLASGRCRARCRVRARRTQAAALPCVQGKGAAPGSRARQRARSRLGARGSLPGARGCGSVRGGCSRRRSGLKGQIPKPKPCD